MGRFTQDRSLTVLKQTNVSTMIKLLVNLIIDDVFSSFIFFILIIIIYLFLDISSLHITS